MGAARPPWGEPERTSLRLLEPPSKVSEETFWGGLEDSVQAARTAASHPAGWGGWAGVGAGLEVTSKLLTQMAQTSESSASIGQVPKAAQLAPVTLLTWCEPQKAVWTVAALPSSSRAGDRTRGEALGRVKL